MKSRLTNTDIVPIMSFGKMPLANKFLDKKDIEKEKFYNMSVGFDEKVSLFQLIEYPKPESMFDENYAFYSGTSKSMQLHFKNFSDWISKEYLKVSEDKRIIEIGCNDGTMLQNFSRESWHSLGVEPSKNVYLESKKKNLNLENCFFSEQFSKTLKSYLNNTDVIYAANVICHIPDLKDLFLGINNLLSKSGVFVFEEPYLGDVLKLNSYDQIYDEHVYLFSLLSVKKICKLFDFDLIDAYPQLTHGGSMRYVVGRKGQHQIKPNVQELIRKEKIVEIDNLETYINFKNNCEKSKIRFKKIIDDYINKKKTICGYAATSKSTTVLNYCDIGPDKVSKIYDTTPIKIGKLSPGKHIPIESYDRFHLEKPDVTILFGWNHKIEILKKEKNYTKNGGIWISHIESIV